MNSKWTLVALLFSVTVNVAVVGTLLYFWRHDTSHGREINIERIDAFKDKELVWFHSPDMPPHAEGRMDSLRRFYHKELQEIEGDIESSRHKIVQILLEDPIDNNRLDTLIFQLANEQTKVERLTIDHLIAIKPMLPQEEWRLFLNDLKPHRKIRTKIIRIGDDTSQILLNETEMHILHDNDDNKIIIEHKEKIHN